MPTGNMPVKTQNRFEVLNDMNNFPILEKATPKRPRSSEAVVSEKYLIVKRKDGDNISFKNVNPFLIQKGLEVITSYIKEVQKLKSGDLLVLTSNNMGTQALLRSKKLANMPVEVVEHQYLNTTRGVIYCPDLKDVTEEDILEGLSSQKVLKVQKIKKRINGEFRNTPLHILTFDATSLPPMIKAGYIVLDVRMYMPNPIRCHNCQKYGHTTKFCLSATVCGTCAKVLQTEHDETNLCEEKRCANGNGNHESNSQQCQTFLIEKEITRIKTIERITYIRAKQKYYRCYANTTGANYAEATKQQQINGHREQQQEPKVQQLSKITQQQELQSQSQQQQHQKPQQQQQKQQQQNQLHHQQQQQQQQQNQQQQQQKQQQPPHQQQLQQPKQQQQQEEQQQQQQQQQTQLQQRLDNIMHGI